MKRWTLAEYYVEATTSSVLIEDLGKWVHPHSPLWVSAKELQSSICIAKLKKMGRLRVTSKTRSQEVRVSNKPPKPPPPPFMALSRPRRGTPKKPTQMSVAEAQKLAIQAAEEAAQKAAQQALEGVLGNLPQPAPASPSISPAQLEEALTKVLASVQLAPAASPGNTTAPVSAGPEEPVYIPKGIVTESATDLDIQSSSSEDSSLGSAASALKALKGKKKSKGKK